MSIVIAPEGATLTKNNNGTYTLSGVTMDVSLTVSTAAHSYGTEWKSDDTNHWRECSCGAKAEVAAHSYGEEWKADGTNHWHECSCSAKNEETTHSGGTATCKDKAVCSACDTVYGEFAAHNYKDGKCTVCEAVDSNNVPETDSSQTGDNSNIWLWFALLLISGGTIITLIIADRKRKSVANK